MCGYYTTQSPPLPLLAACDAVIMAHIHRNDGLMTDWYNGGRHRI
jgi:hypothetical protein